MKARQLPLLGLAMALPACAPGPAVVCDLSVMEQQRQLVAAPSPIPGEPSPIVDAKLDSVSVMDPRLLSKVLVKSVHVRRTPAGTAEVAAQLVNCTDHPLQAEGRVQFFDATTRPSEPLSAWQRVHLQPRSYGTYAEQSIGRAEAVHYLVEIREGR